MFLRYLFGNAWSILPQDTPLVAARAYAFELSRSSQTQRHKVSFRFHATGCEKCANLAVYYSVQP